MNDKQEIAAVQRVISEVKEMPKGVEMRPRLAGGFKIRLQAKTAGINSFLSYLMFGSFLTVPAMLIWGEEPYKIPVSISAAVLWLLLRYVRQRFPSAYKIKTKAYGLKFTTQNGVASIRQRMVIENGIELDFGYQLADPHWGTKPEPSRLWLEIREDGKFQKWGEQADWEEVAWVYQFLNEKFSEANFMAALAPQGSDEETAETVDAEGMTEDARPSPHDPETPDSDYDWHKANL